MKYIKKFNIYFIFIFIFLFNSFSLADLIEEDKYRWEMFYKEIKPDTCVKQWFLPFKTRNRSDVNTIKVISTFGAKRYSYFKGHIHTGIDIIPEKKSSYKFVDVYPMAKGVVCSIHLGHPHKTIVVKHKLSNGDIIFTSYKHLEEIYVNNGKQVTPNTKLARLYTRKEALNQGGNYDHLHLEIRKKFDDYGVASWATMTKQDLNRRFYDPWKFIKKHVK